MRTTCSRSKTKILPSPIFPVLAAFSTASMTRSSNSFLIAASILTLGRKSTTYSAPRYSSVCPFCRPKPLTSVTVMPCTPMADRASRTSSSLNGLMIAVTSFMNVLPVLVMSFEELELVDALQRDGRHGLARHTGVVGEHRVGRLISASFDARLETVGGDERTGQGHLFVLRARRVKAQPILVVERLDPPRDAELRCDHVSDVSRHAVVLPFRVAADGVVLTHVQDFQTD